MEIHGWREGERLCPRAKISNDSSPKVLQGHAEYVQTQVCTQQTHTHIHTFYSPLSFLPSADMYLSNLITISADDEDNGFSLLSVVIMGKVEHMKHGRNHLICLLKMSMKHLILQGFLCRGIQPSFGYCFVFLS